jgi:hypothetical protein
MTLDDYGRVGIPCRCGLTHTGDYAEYDYAHCNCLHTDDLLWIGSEDDIDSAAKSDCVSVICGQCGKTWGVRRMRGDQKP